MIVRTFLRRDVAGDACRTGGGRQGSADATEEAIGILYRKGHVLVALRDRAALSLRGGGNLRDVPEERAGVVRPRVRDVTGALSGPER
ncbi:hypothetical protein GCM10010253_09700 [Streptomyces badius]|uniref:Uncharacterized protein n=1 Tax=Streptomyces badius TaxID=1941 RepID=A0ABQ2SRP3_STRBA|nr:hypothetical protein GCM10010253_09700 [Streptomyces badius]